MIKNCNSGLFQYVPISQNLIFFQNIRLEWSKYCKKHGFCSFYFFSPCCTPWPGVWKKYMLYTRVKPTWKKIPAECLPPPKFFFYEFLKCLHPPPLNMREKKKKFSRIQLFTNYFLWNFKIFEPPPSKAWIFEFWPFSEGFTSRQ